MSRISRILMVVTALSLAAHHVAGDEPAPLAAGVQDNSFLIEEAYNQEAGVVQHIFGLPVAFDGPNKNIGPNFTQEWPVFSQLHQLSYTIPYVFLAGDDSGSGFSDIRLNYRYQALMESARVPAFAPRFTLVIPDGGGKFGHEVVGYETNLPFSKVISDRWTLHFNAGGNVFPNDHNHTSFNYALGGSAIYAASRNFNWMLEFVATWNEDVDDREKTDRTFTALISPGARYAFNLRNHAQLTVGAAVPLGISADAPEWGLFFYFSYEHPFGKTATRELSPK